jgi:hypothetical protein
VVVCYHRLFTPGAEQAVPVNTYYDFMQLNSGLQTVIAQAGGSLQLNVPQIGGGVNVRENDWVALVGNNAGSPTFGLCRWYRVIGLSDNTGAAASELGQLTLAGPDWEVFVSNFNDQVLAVGQEVVGVYTTTVDLDTDATWKN